MRRNLKPVILTVGATALFILYRSTLSPPNPLAEVAESHIQGNVPARSDFDTFLKRDLTAYFVGLTSKPVTVDYEFLRDGPTQTGISFPKYYLWVKLLNGARQIDEGAVRVAAMEQKGFSVTHYLPKADMKKNPTQIDEVFPLPVGDKIKERLK